mgnify:CR=1 FL=1
MESPRINDLWFLSSIWTLHFVETFLLLVVPWPNFLQTFSDFSYSSIVLIYFGNVFIRCIILFQYFPLLLFTFYGLISLLHSSSNDFSPHSRVKFLRIISYQRDSCSSFYGNFHILIAVVPRLAQNFINYLLSSIQFFIGGFRTGTFWNLLELTNADFSL